jgi:hypothetical protein
MCVGQGRPFLKDSPMFEKEYFNLLNELGTHAVGVGPRQATQECVDKYPAFAPFKDELCEYLQNVVRNNNLGMFMLERVKRV